MIDAFAPAFRLARLTTSRQISCLELLDFYLERVAALNPALNAVIVRDAERARARARALDARGPDGMGPLYGVPMTVKESFDFAGHPTSWGFEFRRNHRAEVDALPLRRLQNAGAVIFGKTNVPVALADWQSFNPIYGSTNNPWDLARTPGGSSGGSAAAMAAGLSGLELGSDIGGSIRVPAHFCGVFGHKSSWGLCAARGHSIADSAAPPDLSVIGPLARSARDLETALRLIAGFDPSETEARIVLPEPRFVHPRELRVAVWAHEPSQITDPAVSAAVERAAQFLESLGARIDRAARPDFDAREAYHVFLTLLDAALSQRMPDAVIERRMGLRETLPETAEGAGAVMLRATGMSHRAWLAAHDRRHHMRRAWAALFQEYDVLLCPAAATPALPHQHEGDMMRRVVSAGGQTMQYGDLLFWPGIVGAFHLPATVAPMGRHEGLPVGVQIVGPLFGDLTTLAVAGLLERGPAGFVPPPGY